MQHIDAVESISVLLPFQMAIDQIGCQ
jgi:hypothetical protein